MAEMTVRARYESKVAKTALAGLRLTFPVWGVVAPTVAVVSIFAIVGNLTYNGLDYYWTHPITATEYAMMGMILSGLVLPILALLSIRALSNDFLMLDKNGMQIPFIVRLWGRYVEWRTIKKVQILPSDDRPWKKKRLILSGPSRVNLNLGNISAAELEQILLAIEMWAVAAESDQTVKTLQTQLKSNAIGAKEQLSYTDMWEDELRRRFCPTVFIPLEPGTTLANGSLKVVRQLALGGLSAVYLCQQDEKRLLVLKEAVVPEDSAEAIREKAREMFERESRLLMKLKHPHIVQVLDYFVESGRNYMLLEYVNGQDLRQLVKQQGPQKEAVVLEWAVQIAAILKYLHEQEPPIIHRDLTPDNLVLRDDGSIVLIDFGAANEFIGNATGTFVGKQAFIAPEQFRGKAVLQSDIYAFGCTLHYLLTGQEPEALATSMPRELTNEVSQEINDLVSCCTEVEARDRYQSAGQLIPVLKKMAASVAAV